MLCLVAQLYLTLCDPMDCNLPGASVHGILQARILERVAMPPPGDLPNLGIKPRSPALQTDSLSSEPPGKLVRSRCNLSPNCLFFIMSFYINIIFMREKWDLPGASVRNSTHGKGHEEGSLAYAKA